MTLREYLQAGETIEATVDHSAVPAGLLVVAADIFATEAPAGALVRWAMGIIRPILEITIWAGGRCSQV